MTALGRPETVPSSARASASRERAREVERLTDSGDDGVEQVRHRRLPDQQFGQVEEPPNLDRSQLGLRDLRSGGSIYLGADTGIGPTLFTPRSRARPLEDAFHGKLILPATALNRISA